MSDLRRATAERNEKRSLLLREFPVLEDDEQALNDTLSGIDDLEERIIAVLRHALVREAMADGLKTLIDSMTARKRRLEDGAKSLRAAVLQAIQESTIELPIRSFDMTIGVGRSKPRVVIVDADKIPDALCEIVREPSRTLIAEALEKGDVPGATLGNPQPFVTIHRN